MTILNFSGFETGDLSEFQTNAVGTVAVQNSVARIGSYAFQVNPTTTGTGYGSFGIQQANGSVGNASVANAFVRFYLNIGTLPASASEEFCAFHAASSVYKLSLRLTSAGKIAAYDSTTTLISTGATILTTGTWYLIEAKCGTGASAAWEVKINGVSEISASNSNLTTSNNAVFVMGKFTDRNNQTVNFYYDDFIWNDSAYSGAGQSSILLPASNGTYQTFTIGAGSGSHYQIVNEVPPNGNTSYLVSTGTAGNAETENVQTRAAAGISVGTVNCVKTYVNWARDGAANGSASIRLRSNTTDSDSTAVATTPGYVAKCTIKTTDPATSAAWLPSALDTLQIGAVEAGANKTRLTAAYIFVDYTIPPPASSGCFIPLLGVG